MIDKQLLDYIVEDRKHRISDYIGSWLSTCSRVNGFLYTYKDKIRSKVRCAKSDEDLEDIRFELEVAYLFLLDKRFEIEYEKYCTGNSRAPDYFVTFKQAISFNVNVEVKRIRETDAGIRLKKLLKKFEGRIREIPSKLGVSISVTHLRPDIDFIDRLECLKEKILAFIENTIKKEEGNIPCGDLAEYPIPGLESELILELSKPLSKYDTKHTSYHNGLMPIFYTQKEHYKFGDTVFEKLGQILPDMANLLIIGSDSSTHEQEDLSREIRIITEFVNKKNDDFFTEKGFKGVEDFTAQMKNLSAILFRSIWINNSNQRNLLWINENANFELPKDIIKFLHSMDKPKVITRHVQ